MVGINTKPSITRYVPQYSNLVEYIYANNFLYPILETNQKQEIEQYLTDNFSVSDIQYNNSDKLPKVAITFPINDIDSLIFNLITSPTVPLGLLIQNTGAVIYTFLNNSKPYYAGVLDWITINYFAFKVGIPSYTYASIPSIGTASIASFSPANFIVDFLWVSKNFPSSTQTIYAPSSCLPVKTTFSVSGDDANMYLSFTNTSVNEGQLVLNGIATGNFVSGGSTVCNVPIKTTDFNISAYFQGRIGQPITQTFNIDKKWVFSQNWDETKTILVSPSPPRSIVPPTPPSNESKKTSSEFNWILGIIIGGSVLLLILFGLLLYFSEPSPVIELQPQYYPLPPPQ